MFRVNNFDKLLDKATSNLRLDPDWPTILQICDLIRQNDCTPKYAVAGVKKKLYSTNPHQAMFALLTLESIVKNCGSGVHDEVTSKAFCEMLRDLVKTTQHENLKTKILELIQAWAFAFRNSPKYRAVQDTVNILKAEGFKFPTLKESDAMFSADTAPEWAEGEVCHRCRVAFSLIVRKHHCRACGQVFCQQCSSKTSTLPKFGIEKEVRVCDACFDKVSRPPAATSAKSEIVDAASDYGPAQPQKRPSTAPAGKTAEELQEEEELQLALALSQSEAEHKEKERKSRPHIAPDPTPHPTASPTASSVSASPEHSTQANSELSRYLDRNYWESRLARDSAAAPTAPAPGSQASHDTAELQDFATTSVNKAQDDDAQDKEMDDFVETLKSQVEIFVNRMKSNSSRGRSIANDTAVQTLFMNITAMHSRLLKYIQQLDDKRVYLESLQDKVTQIRDSRAALDTLRAEHAARTQQAAEAAERQRQMQMAVKLQAMRKKKHEYLQYQRQLALQRVQEQEREMQLRQEQQKHQYMMSANSYYMPGVSMQQYQQPYPNQPIYANPQFHQMMPQNDANLPQQINQPNLPNQLATIAQSMPQLPNYSMAQSTAAVTQPPATQSMTHNRPNPQIQMTPMMMQQMHQMRMPVQPGMHQMLPQTGQTQNGALPKQNLPNQPNSMMPQMGQQNIPQQMMNPNMGMHMQNMRMPMMQGNNPQIQGYISLPNNTQAPSMQQSQIMPGQLGPIGPMQGLPTQMPGHNIPTSMPSGQVPQTQGQQMPPGQITQQPHQMSQPQPMSQQPQMSQPQQMPQSLPQQPQQMNQQPHQMNQQPQQMNQQPQQINQQLPQMAQQPQQMNHQPQQMNQQPQQINQQPQQMPSQSVPHNQMAPGQPMPGQPMPGPPMQSPGHMMMQPPQSIQMQGPQVQMNQGPSNPGQALPQQMMQGPMPSQVQGQMQQIQGQPSIAPGQAQVIKMPPNNFIPGQPGQPMVNQQTQQPQTPVKSEHNKNTAELISFD